MQLPPRPRGWAPLIAVLASMTSVQVGAALSVPLFDTFAVTGTTWLRLAMAALILLVVARPHQLARADLAAAALLGVVMAANTTAFAQATDRIPLGVTVAVEFCGPLAVAAIAAADGGPRRLLWPLVAFAGVLLLTRPWSIGGESAGRTWAGLGLAAVAGVGWAGYIVLTARVGRRSEGLTGLAVALTVAALALAPFGSGTVLPVLRAAVAGSRAALTSIALCALAAALVPLAAFALEMMALRRMEQAVFGVWMALEPAIGTGVGLLVLGQRLAWWQLPGVALVVAAGIGAQRAASRRTAGYPARTGPAGSVPLASTAPP